MNALQLPTLGKEGRFGNWLQLYAFGRRLAEQHNLTLETPDWEGRKIFALTDPIIGEVRGEQFNFEAHKIYQPNYTMADFRKFFPFQRWITESPQHHLAVHIRRGDFVNSPHWPEVELETIKRGVEAHGFNFAKAELVTEECPHIWGRLSPYLDDFILMVLAQNLFVYPSSSFSGCAGMLNTNYVFLPHAFINGKTDCEWRLR